jgi:hypothetical protein
VRGILNKHTFFLFTHHHFEKAPRLEFQDAFSEVVVAFAEMAAGGSEDEAVVRLWDADEQGKLLFSARDCFERQTIFVAVDDNEVHDCARNVSVSHTILSSTDVDYSNAQVSVWPGREVLVLIGDKKRSGIALSVSSLEVTMADQSESYRVSLNSKPVEEDVVREDASSGVNVGRQSQSVDIYT